MTEDDAEKYKTNRYVILHFPALDFLVCKKKHWEFQFFLFFLYSIFLDTLAEAIIFPKIKVTSHEE